MSEGWTINENDDWWVQMTAVTAADPAHLNAVAQTRDWALQDEGQQKVLLTMAAHPALSLVSAVYLYQMFPVAELSEPASTEAERRLRDAMLSVPAALRDGLRKNAYKHDPDGFVDLERCAGVVAFADALPRDDTSDWSVPAQAVRQAAALVRWRTALRRPVASTDVLHDARGDRTTMRRREPDVKAYLRSPLRGRVRLHPTHPLAYVERMFIKGRQAAVPSEGNRQP